MKSILIPIIALTLVSCQKEDGYMFKAFHRIKSDHKRNCSDFFLYTEKDEEKALRFYNETRPWNPKMIEIDSTWVEYYCTEREWNRK